MNARLSIRRQSKCVPYYFYFLLLSPAQSRQVWKLLVRWWNKLRLWKSVAWMQLRCLARVKQKATGKGKLSQWVHWWLQWFSFRDLQQSEQIENAEFAVAWTWDVAYASGTVTSHAKGLSRDLEPALLRRVLLVLFFLGPASTKPAG